ncbi:hypothetical protein GQ457_13G018100 [Hibiscus cannabinus]
MFAASFDNKMGCLYSVFGVKKQGKPAWVVRTRNWKLRGGENRLSGLLEGVSVSGNVFTWLSSGLMMFRHVAAQFSACLVSSIGTLTGYRYPNSTLEFGYRYQQGRVSVPLVSILAIRVSMPPGHSTRYRYQGRVSVPKPPTGTWVSILAFGYRYQLLENSFWAPLKSDFLHMGPYDCHICTLSSGDVFILKSHS